MALCVFCDIRINFMSVGMFLLVLTIAVCEVCSAIYVLYQFFIVCIYCFLVKYI